MGSPFADPIADALFPGSRQAILGILYADPDHPYYLRQIIRLANTGTGQTQRELTRLSEAGIILRFTQGRHVYFQADPSCPVFNELRSIVTKSVGAGAALRHSLEDFAGRIRLAFVFGSVARGEERSASDLDLLVVGEVSFSELVVTISEAEETLRREINPTLFTEEDLRNRLSNGNHFLESVLRGEKIFLIGDEDELGNLLPEWMAEEAHHLSRRDR